MTRWDGQETHILVDFVSSPQINTGPGAANRLGVIANGGSYQLYVNGQLLAGAGDAAYVDEMAADQTLAAMKQAIKEGKIYADPIQFPKKMGVVTMENILKYLNGDDFETVQLIPAELYRRADAENDPDLK